MSSFKCLISAVLVAFLLVFSLGISAGPIAGQQSGTITGSVEDSQTGLPLSSVQVFIAGLNIGALSQANGVYVIQNVLAGTHTLTADRIGYESVNREVTVGAGATVVLDFDLGEAALQLDAIIVTGTAGGTQRRAIGNVVERIDVASLSEAVPAISVEQVLSSRVPGLTLSAAQGGVGMDAGVIRIRGASSLGLSNEPIVYVDGIRINSDRTSMSGTTASGAFSRLNDITPEHIESIEVIKGPAAATLYGTEASNGVIQIITKRGTQGSPVFDARLEVGANWAIDPENEFPTLFGRGPTGDLITMNLYRAEIERFGEPPFGYGPMQRYSLSVRGGTELFRYFGSVNRSDLEGFVDWNWDERTAGRVNLSVTPSEQVNIDLNMSVTTGETRHPGNIWAEFIRGRVITAVDFGGLEHFRRGYGSRPLEEWRDGREDLTNIDRVTWSGTVRYDPRDWLSNRLVLGSDYSSQIQRVTTFRQDDAPRGTFGSAGRGRKTINGIETRNVTFDYAGTVTLGLTDNVGSASSFGVQYYKREVVTDFRRGDEFATRALTTLGAAALTQASEDFLENATLGVYLQQQLDWNERIFVTGAVRADDNSAFGANFDAAYYPKVSATWVVHEEPFWGWDLIEQLRLRGAWGAAGLQPDVFAAQKLYEPVTGPGDQPVTTRLAFGNPDLGPERGEELELGFDASFWDSRVEMNYTWYSRTTKDAIVSRPLAPSLGFPGSQLVNIGQVSNWGHELSLRVELVSRDAVQWDVNLAFATTHNRIDDLGADVDRLPVGISRSNVEGYPLAGQHEIKILSADFVSGDSGPVTNIMCDGGTGSDGRRMGGLPVPCADAPALYWGRAGEPTWNLTVNPNLTLFQNWRLSATIDARGGHMVTQSAINASHTSWSNSLPVQLLDDPIFVAYRQIKREPLGFFKAGFARLREVSLHYTLPTGWAEGLGASRAAVSVAGRNLALLWQEQKFTDIGNSKIGDPEKVMGFFTSGGAGGQRGFESFMGESHAGTEAPRAQAVVTVSVSF